MKREVLDTNMDKVVDLADFKRKGLTFGGDGEGENWLKTIPCGTDPETNKRQASVIVCKRKNCPRDVLALDLFFVLEHRDIVSNVIQKVPTGQQADMWVNSLEFSRYYTLVATIATVGMGMDLEQEEAELTDNGNSARTFLPRGMGHDEEPQG